MCAVNMSQHAVRLPYGGDVLLVSDPHGFEGRQLDPDTSVWLTA